MDKEEILPLRDMNRRIVLLTPADGQDAAGGPLPPTASPSFWASIDTPYGQNLYQGQFVSIATHLIKIRYRTDISSSMKIGYGANSDGTFKRRFNIEYIANPKERNVALWLFCTEIT